MQLTIVQAEIIMIAIAIELNLFLIVSYNIILLLHVMYVQLICFCAKGTVEIVVSGFDWLSPFPCFLFHCGGADVVSRRII